MPKTYPSKISKWMLSILSLSHAVPIVMILLRPEEVDAPVLVVTALLALSLLLCLSLFLRTRYILDGRTLVIKAGWMRATTIDIQEIYSIRDTYDMLAAPASSLDRLEIKYGAGRRTLVSPHDKEDFIKTLLKIQPSIEVKRRKTSKL